MKKVTEEGIPSGYNITDADIHGVLPFGKTISSEIKAGRLFMIDCSIIDGIPCGEHPITKVWTISENIVC